MSIMSADKKKRSLSLGQLVFALSAAFLGLALITLLGISSYIQDRAVRDLAQEDARQTSRLVFESLYSAMRKGWTQSEIQEIIQRLNQIEPEMKIRVYRGESVIRQFGELPGESEARRTDEVLAESLRTGKEYLLPSSELVRYIYPMKAEAECIGCHTLAKVGDVNGVIDIVFPVRDLKVSLDFIIDVVIWYFVIVMSLLFLVLYFKLRFLVARPVLNLVQLIQEVTQNTDLTKRVKHFSWITELKHLASHFNSLLSSLQNYNEQLEDLSIRDPLTNLYNRRRFERFMEFEVNRASRHNFEFSVMMLDMDNFKHINDTFGHPIGDLALREMALLLEKQLRTTDVIARLGGDEFAIIMPDTAHDEGMRVADKLLRVINTTELELPVGNTRIVASIGMVTFPHNGTDVDSLFTAMDVAMYKAKRMGKNQVMTFDENEQKVMMDVFSRGEFVRKALEEDRLVPFMQPIISIKTGQVVAYEALARVVDGSEVIAASDFIDIAEEVGLGREIDLRILKKVIELKGQDKLEGVKVFCNLSSKTFGDKKLMHQCADRLESAGISLEDIVLEITEREALPHISELRTLTEELRNRGLAFALDDFGSGFSSFLYLKYLQVDYVKIEGSFIRHIAGDKRDRIMVDHINRMAQKFDLKTIAEFVEDEEAHKILIELGVDFAQGYHYGRPKFLS